MSRQLQDIFEECVERLRQGDSVENCLMSYPEVAAELEILLRTALNVNWRASMVQPRPYFKARARAQFIAAQQYAAQVKESKPKPTFFSLQRAWMPALAVVLILVLSSVGTAAAASNAMPDEPLYPVKIATEQAHLTLTFSDEDKAEINVKLAETRSQEIATMATQGKTEQVVVTTERLAQNLEAAEVAIQKVEETKTSQTLTTPQETTTVPTQPAPEPTPEPTPVPEPAQPAPVPSPIPTPEPSTSATSEKPQDTTGQAGGQPAPSPEKVTITKAERLRQSLRVNITKNINILENAKNKAPEQSKQAIQRAIDISKSRQIQLQQPHPETQPKSRQDPRNPQTIPDPLKGNWSQEPPQQGAGTEGKVIPTPTITPSTPSETSGTRNNTGDVTKPPSSTTNNTTTDNTGTDTTKR